MSSVNSVVLHTHTIHQYLPYMRVCAVTSVMSDSAIPWTVARQAPLSTGFPKREYWSGLPFPPPRDLPDPGMKLASLAAPALADGYFTTEPPGKPLTFHTYLVQTAHSGHF